LNRRTGAAIRLISRFDTNLQQNLERLKLTGPAVIGNGNGADNDIRGNGLNNALTGGGGDDRLIGGSGNDALFGNMGDDHLMGGVGNDGLIGGNGADRLNGASGMDTLNGGAGRDILTGGSGADVFVFDAPLTSGNVDRITDFNVPQDRILLDNDVFSGLGRGGLAASAFVANATGQAGSAAHRIIYETDTGNLYYDRDGAGGAAAVKFAELNSGLAMTHADFFVF
jgi:serralysin